MAKKKQEGAVWFRMFRNIRNVVEIGRAHV